jgi:phosphohistidine phosphatase
VRRTTAVLARAEALGLRGQRLLCSPLRRARQTAEIALAAGLAPALELARALEPEGDPLPLLAGWLAGLPQAGFGGGSGRASASSGASALEASPSEASALPQPGAAAAARLLLVGHEPDLGDLAARLIGAPAGSIVLRKAGLALLDLPRGAWDSAQLPGLGCWRLRLLLTPQALLG